MNEEPDVIIEVGNGQIITKFKEDLSLYNIFRYVWCEFFDEFLNGEKYKIEIGSSARECTLELLKMLHLNPKDINERGNIEFWTNKTMALVLLEEAILLDDFYHIPIINRIIRFGVLSIIEMYKDKFPNVYRNMTYWADDSPSLCNSLELWELAELDHMVIEISISNEKGDITFGRMMAESLQFDIRGPTTYYIDVKSKEKQDEILKFLEKISKEENLKVKIIKNEQNNA